MTDPFVLLRNPHLAIEDKSLRMRIMNRFQFLLTLILVLTFSFPAHADEAKSAFDSGVQAESENKYDAAFEAYRQAAALKPKNAQYLAAYVRLRSSAGIEHVRKGLVLRESGKLTEALAEFGRAAEIDRTNFIAQQEAQRTTGMIRKQARHEEPGSVTPQSPLVKMAEEAAGPLEMGPLSSTPINLRMSSNADQIYKIIGKMAGLNVLFDPDYRPQHVSIELNDVTTREALGMLAMETKTFWQPVSANTIVVAADTTAKRKELEDNVMKTFYLRNLSTQAELQEAANILKGILDLSRIQLVASQSAMVLRGTPDQMVLAQKLLSDLDKPKAEVVINITVLEVRRDRLRTLGTTPPTSASIAMGGGPTIALNAFQKLTSGNFLLTVPGATFTALMSDSNTKVIQSPEIRALDNEKATLRIGDRVPVATGSYSGGVSNLVNTQFQYLDVGVNIDVTPHIHSESEVTLKMALEISSVAGSNNIGGISEPVIGQRRIEHEMRLLDGEVNLVGGILEDTETQSMSGLPWVQKIPLLRYLFAQDQREKQESEIVFAITPHIVRAQEVTEQNERLVDVGSGNSVGLRHAEPKTTKPNSSTSPATPTPQTAVPQTPGPQATPPAPPRPTATPTP